MPIFFALLQLSAHRSGVISSSTGQSTRPFAPYIALILFSTLSVLPGYFPWHTRSTVVLDTPNSWATCFAPFAAISFLRSSIHIRALHPRFDKLPRVRVIETRPERGGFCARIFGERVGVPRASPGALGRRHSEISARFQRAHVVPDR